MLSTLPTWVLNFSLKHCFWWALISALTFAQVPLKLKQQIHLLQLCLVLQVYVKKRWQHFPQCFKSHQVQSEKWRTIFFCLHIIYTSGPSWHIWVFAFLPHCLSERRNTLLIGRLTSSRSACSTAHPLSVDYCGNISPVEYLLSPLDWFSVYSDLKILSLPSHHIVT